jgi:hypothetical protein
LGRRVCWENDITHSGAEMVVVLVLFHPYDDTFLIYGLAAFAFSIFPDSPFKTIVCLDALLMQIKDLLRGITLDILALKE